MSAHTPGPPVRRAWVLFRGDRPGTFAYDTKEAAEGDVSKGHEVVELSEHTSEANARLIAAAPELLEALEAALLRCEDCGTSGDAHCPACESARAAIAKARGDR